MITAKTTPPNTMWMQILLSFLLTTGCHMWNGMGAHSTRNSVLCCTTTNAANVNLCCQNEFLLQTKKLKGSHAHPLLLGVREIVCMDSGNVIVGNKPHLSNFHEVEKFP